MIKVGDRVKINIDNLEHNGLEETETQREAYEYILDHPDEVYSVKSESGLCLARIILDHSVLGATSFFSDELIKVGDNE